MQTLHSSHLVNTLCSEHIQQQVTANAQSSNHLFKCITAWFTVQINTEVHQWEDKQQETAALRAVCLQVLNHTFPIQYESEERQKVLLSPCDVSMRDAPC